MCFLICLGGDRYDPRPESRFDSESDGCTTVTDG